MSKTRKITIASLALALALSLVLAFSFMSTSTFVRADGETDPSTVYDFYLDAASLETGNITDTLEVGSMILQGSSSKPLSVDGNVKSPIDMVYSFTKRVKFNGVTDQLTLDRSISFYLEKKAEISIYALSSSSSDSERTIALYKNGYVDPATTAPIALQSHKVEGSQQPIEPIKFTTTEAGSYYLSADINGINVYFIGVKYTGDADPIVRGDWANVATPSITDVKVNETDKNLIDVTYSANVGKDGADFLYVSMFNSANELVAKKTVLRYGTSGTVSFIPSASGTYSFEVEAVRKNSTDASKKSTEAKICAFTYVLRTALVRARTIENGVMAVSISKVTEATSYDLAYRKINATDWTIVNIPADNNAEVVYNITGLAVNDKIEFKVTAKRGDETTETGVNTATLRAQAERDWQFTYFGASTKEAYNYMYTGGNIYDGLTLNSCTINAETNETASKGGKFTYGAMDGISYYYTKIKASDEDFRIKSRVIVDYINPTPDGQEGFALLVRDSIGVHADSNYFYTNSVAAIATKLQYAQGATNKTIRDGLGARFVVGVKDTDTAPEAGSFTNTMYPFMNDTVYQTANKTTDGYIIEVEKINNCYYTRYYLRDFKIDGTYEDVLEEEHVLYHDGSVNNGADGKDQLLMIDKDYVYVGFAVARGCNASFADIEFETSPRSTTPIQIENEKIVGDYAITSPTTSSIPEYTVRFTANADGTLNLKQGSTSIATNVEVKANEEHTVDIILEEGANTISGTFLPKAGFQPGLYQEMDSYELQDLLDKIVTYKAYGTASTPIYVAPDDGSSSVVGAPNNEGTKASPLDLQTAVNHVLAGQTIYMLEGSYTFGGNLSIERGNNGTADAYKTLTADPSCKTRPVIDFQDKGTGIKMWGQYWHLSGFDITKTKYGNKGIQLGGKNNILENVNAYYNGDTGISVSGKSTESKAMWPSDNLVLNCTSYMNKDQAQEDADGFAAKLYCSDNNVFRGCIAYCNADDGWDLYAKTESGQIGSVTIENCLTFGNGFNIDGTATKGNGNGFKLGGESLPGAHVLRNSISFANKLKGIDSNSCPDDIVSNCTSVYNGTYNYAFYSTKKTSFQVSNCISLKGNKSDQIAGQTPSLYNAGNFFYTGDPTNATANSEGTALTMDIFEGWNNNFKDYFGFTFNQDTKTIGTGNFEYIINKVTVRNADGSINTNGILRLKDTTSTSGAILDSASTNTASGCNKGCKSSIGAVESVIAVAGLAVLLLVLLKKQKKASK